MNISDLSLFMLVAIFAMAICMAITPIMIRLAPTIGMVDAPDARKVHATAIPRSGGIGIVIGLIIPLMVLMQLDKTLISILAGCTILLLFGAWDDAKNIRPAIKFLGQFLAAGICVYYGDIYVFHFPFMGLNELSTVIGKPFTVIAIVGMINALNLSDGLDGLAGGEALISLIAVSYLAYLFGGDIALAVAAATIGGIFGFLRFNSHPARIFMGDAGSQTLGFILGVMVVYLSQNVNAVISPVVALLMLGLPVLDSLVVFYTRARRGDSLVVAAKDHLHHRLLGLGFYHYESVTIIYTAQMLLVATAVLLPYESDLLLMSIYILFGLILYAVVGVAERRQWRVHQSKISRYEFISQWISGYSVIEKVPYRITEAMLSIVLIATALTATAVPMDIGGLSLVMLLLLIGAWFFVQSGLILLRLIIFMALGTSSYLLTTYPPQWLLDQTQLVYLFYGVLMVAAFIGVRMSQDEQFTITPLDYLVIAISIVVIMVPGTGAGAVSNSNLAWIAIQMVILFYSAELLIQKMRSPRCRLTATLFASLILLISRSFL